MSKKYTEFNINITTHAQQCWENRLEIIFGLTLYYFSINFGHVYASDDNELSTFT
jgi:hypothetical protein